MLVHLERDRRRPLGSYSCNNYKILVTNNYYRAMRAACLGSHLLQKPEDKNPLGIPSHSRLSPMRSPLINFWAQSLIRWKRQCLLTPSPCIPWAEEQSPHSLHSNSLNTKHSKPSSSPSAVLPPHLLNPFFLGNYCRAQSEGCHQSRRDLTASFHHYSSLTKESNEAGIEQARFLLPGDPEKVWTKMEIQKLPTRLKEEQSIHFHLLHKKSFIPAFTQKGTEC